MNKIKQHMDIYGESCRLQVMLSVTIQKAMAAKRVSVGKLAQRIKQDPKWLRRFLDGQQRKITVDDLAVIGQALNVHFGFKWS